MTDTETLKRILEQVLENWNESPAELYLALKEATEQARVKLADSLRDRLQRADFTE